MWGCSCITLHAMDEGKITSSALWLWEEWGSSALLRKSKTYWRKEEGFNSLIGLILQCSCGLSENLSWRSLPCERKVVLKARRSVLPGPLWRWSSLVLKVAVTACHFGGSPWGQRPCPSLAGTQWLACCVTCLKPSCILLHAAGCSISEMLAVTQPGFPSCTKIKSVFQDSHEDQFRV